MVIGSTLGAEEGVVAGVIGPGVVEEVTCVCNLVVSHLFEGRGAVDDARGDAVVGVGLSQGLGAFKALDCDIG